MRFYWIMVWMVLLAVWAGPAVEVVRSESLVTFEYQATSTLIPEGTSLSNVPFIDGESVDITITYDTENPAQSFETFFLPSLFMTFSFEDSGVELTMAHGVLAAFDSGPNPTENATILIDIGVFTDPFLSGAPVGVFTGTIDGLSLTDVSLEFHNLPDPPGSAIIDGLPTEIFNPDDAILSATLLGMEGQEEQLALLMLPITPIPTPTSASLIAFSIAAGWISTRQAARQQGRVG